MRSTMELQDIKFVTVATSYKLYMLHFWFWAYTNLQVGFETRSRKTQNLKKYHVIAAPLIYNKQLIRLHLKGSKND